MLRLIFLIVFVLVALLLPAGLYFIAHGKKTKGVSYYDREDEIFFGRGATAVGSVAVLLILCMSLTVVPARTVGINLSFGKPVGTFSNGIHLKTPWSTVERLDLAVQNNIYNGQGSVPVRLANSAKANVDASIQWRLKSDGAEQTYLDYRSFESIESNLIDRNFRAALNETLVDYDPLAVIRDGDSTDQRLEHLAEETANRMQEKVGAQVEVRSVTIPIINFDDATQARIDELQTEFARTRIAEQKQKTNQAESAANRELQNSITQDVLTDKCLNIVRETKQSPLGCFPNSGVQPVREAK